MQPRHRRHYGNGAFPGKPRPRSSSHSRGPSHGPKAEEQYVSHPSRPHPTRPHTLTRTATPTQSIPNSGILQSPLSPVSTPKTLGSWRPGRASATGSRLASSKARPQRGQAAAEQGGGARGAPHAGQAAKGPGWHCHTGAPAGKRPILRP